MKAPMYSAIISSDWEVRYRIWEGGETSKYDFPIQHSLVGATLVRAVMEAYRKGDYGEMEWIATQLDYLDFQDYLGIS